MPRIPKDWLDAIVYLYPCEEDARGGCRTGATGFILVVPPDDPELPQELGHYYIVSNAHCIERETTFVRINLRAGGADVVPFPRESWATHPERDDVAVAYFNPGPAAGNFRGVGINKPMILTDDLQSELEFGPGDEVFFMGRYVDIDGREHNEPVLRSGMLAGFPSAPIHQPERAHHQQTILVEARSLSGFSGSPVFVWSPHQLQRTEEGVPVANVVLGPQCYLLGIDYGHHPWRERVRSKHEHGQAVPDLFVEGNSGMMLVVPAQKMLDVLAVDTLAKARAVREEQERHARAHPVAVLDSATFDDEQ